MLDIRYALSGEVTSSDSSFLDQIEAALPTASESIMGRDFTKSRIQNDDGSETLSATLRLAADGESAEVELPDGSTQTVTPDRYGRVLFDHIASSDLANQADGWELRFYRAPQGGVLASDVREWYEATPSKHPTRTDDDGTTESFVPSSWNADHHTLAYETG
jgi:hypothetical protein